MFDLQSITRSTQLPPRVVIYGVPGIGKTTFASMMPAPIFLPIEDGLGQLDVATFPRPTSYSEVLNAIDTLAEGCWDDEESPGLFHNYQTLVIDSLDKLEPMIWDHVCESVPGDRGAKVDRIEQYGYGKGYTHALSEWRRLLRGLDHLRELGIGIACIAHSAVVRFESPETDAYERYQLRLHKGADATICDWADAVLFANYKVAVVETATGKKRGIGKGERMLHTQERPAFRAKNRYSMPDQIPMDWNQVAPFITNQNQ